MIHLSRYEQETIINFNEEEDSASIYTHHRPFIRRLEQLAQERPEDCRLFKVSHWDQAVEYYIPKSWVKVNPSRILSDEQRAAMKERGKNSVLFKNSRTIIGEQPHEAAEMGNDTPPAPGR